MAHSRDLPALDAVSPEYVVVQPLNEECWGTNYSRGWVGSPTVFLTPHDKYLNSISHEVLLEVETNIAYLRRFEQQSLQWSQIGTNFSIGTECFIQYEEGAQKESWISYTKF